MSTIQLKHQKASVAARNIGGITDTSVTFTPGVTILVGRNATNRTSFLQAVMAALGSDNVAIKGDADDADVELTLGGDTYTRHLHRRSGGVVTDGDPYLDDPELADLFAFLLEFNETRRAVAASDDLRELIMRPVDTDEIQAEIDSLTEDRKDLNQELDELDALKSDLPDLEAERTRVQDQIEEKRAELEEKEAELDAADADVDETRKEKSELEEKLEELREKRTQLDDIRYDLETERESLKVLEGEQRELDDEYAELPDAPMGEIEELEGDLERLREQKQRLETEVNELQSIISFNEELLEDTGGLAGLADDTDDVTDQLLDDVTCWTCGNEVEREQIESTMGRLRDVSQAKVSEINDLDEQIDDIRSEKRTLEQAQRERDRIERHRSELDDKHARSEDTIERLQEHRETLTEEIEGIEAEVDELESEDFGSVLDLHKEANQLEYELEKLETDLDQVENEIADIEDRLAEQDDIEDRLDDVNDDIEALRTRIERIEQDAVEGFNEHMDTVLDLLEYANLERIWIERVEREVREGRRKKTKRVFELHVIRNSESGAAYEDTIEHLSESEREVTGLVFALAGYLAHEVYDQVPFILLDSLEAIDSGRIATLVDYLDDYTGYLLVAMLPEDAQALDDEYERMTEI
jgi:chromosome segregation ATPase